MTSSTLRFKIQLHTLVDNHVSFFVSADDVITLTLSSNNSLYVDYIGKEVLRQQKMQIFFGSRTNIEVYTLKSHMLLAKSAQWFHHWFTLSKISLIKTTCLAF